MSNRITSSETVRGETAYIYGLKARAQRHHCLGYGTFAVDLANLEVARRRYSREVRPITYLPLYVKAMGLAVQRNPEANAILFKKLFGLRIVNFEQVDVNLPITRKVGDRVYTFIGTIRNAPAKTLAEIQDELAHYQRCPPEESPAIQRILKFSRMPLWLAKLVHWRMTRSPDFYIRNVGTCGLTLVDSDHYDHMFPIAPTSAVFGIGAPKREPVVRGDRIAIARVLKCTLMIDNYVVSGLTAGRLARDFQQILETAEFVNAELSNHKT